MNGKKRLFIYIFLIFLCSVIFNLNFGFFEKLELNSYDLKVNIKGRTPLNDRIVLVYFNNYEIKQMGGMPLQRNIYANLIKDLQTLDPLAIGLSIFLVKESLDYPEYDNYFVETLKEYNNVSSVFYFDEINENKPESESETGDMNSSIQIFSDVFTYGKTINIPDTRFVNCFSGLGFTNVITDIDGKIRKAALFTGFQDNIYPHFVLQIIYDAYMEGEKSGIYHNNSTLSIGNHRIKNVKKGIARINYKADTGDIKKYSVLEILDLISDGETETLKNKIFIIAVVAEGLSILQSTPLENNGPFVSIYANMIDNILNNDFLSDINSILAYLITLTFSLAILSVFSLKLGLRGIILGSILFIVYIIMNFFFMYAGIYMKFIPGLLLNIVAFSCGISILFSEEKTIRLHLEEKKDEMEILLDEKEEILLNLQKELKTIENNKKDSEAKFEIVEKIQQYKSEIENLKNQIKDQAPVEIKKETGKQEKYPDIIYKQGGKISEILDLAEKVADETVPVLISGESGTGKELIARTVHSISNRKDKPFIAVNCGALTETLLESELFGHEKGAFTGAVSSKKGRFELADGGILFLDEITETSLSFQVKLLRVLQQGEFERVGGEVTKKVNVRIIAATNKDIKTFVNEGKFREDLYFRINVFNIKMPPLRDRRDDMDILIDSFIAREGYKGKGLSGLAYEALKGYSWPGNVRELENCIKRALILSESEKRDILKITDFPEEIQKFYKETFREKDNMPDLILAKLREEEFGYGAISKTADHLGNINRGTVSEYFRGICFREFVESGYDRDIASVKIAGKNEKKVIENVRKKITEFLSNGIELTDKKESIEHNLELSKSKYTNLPKVFHAYLDNIIESYIKNKWQIE